MNQTQMKAIEKAVAKGLKLGLDAQRIANLAATYEELLSEDDTRDDRTVEPGGGLIILSQSFPEPPPMVNQIVSADHKSAAPEVRRLSATGSIGSETASEKSLDDMFEDIRNQLKDRPTVSFTAPGYKKAMSYNLEPYKNDQYGVCGICFSQVGDRSNVASRTAYPAGKTYDLDHDIQEFIDSQKQIYKARSQPVVARVPPPMSWNEATAECAGMVD